MIANDEDDENDELINLINLMKWKCENVKKNFRTMYFIFIWDTFIFIYSRQMNIFYEFVQINLTSF
jgi:hypothetical protein